MTDELLNLFVNFPTSKEFIAVNFYRSIKQSLTAYAVEMWGNKYNDFKFSKFIAPTEELFLETWKKNLDKQSKLNQNRFHWLKEFTEEERRHLSTSD